MKRGNWRHLYKNSLTFLCPYCLQRFPIKLATKEFEPPISRQKTLGPSKLKLACESCNKEKGALTAAEYKQWKKAHDYYAWVRLEKIRTGQTKGC